MRPAVNSASTLFAGRVRLHQRKGRQLFTFLVVTVEPVLLSAELVNSFELEIKV